MGWSLPDTPPTNQDVINTVRSIALEFSTIKLCFDSLGEVLREHGYLLNAIYNIDETRSSIESSKKSIVLLDQLNQRWEKKKPGQKKWITCLECVSASGVSLRAGLTIRFDSNGWKYISHRSLVSQLNHSTSQLSTVTLLTLRPSSSPTVSRRKSTSFHYTHSSVA